MNDGKKDVFAEAKGEGFDVKVLKEILRLRKEDKDERDEQESLLDLYLRAMESAGPSQAQAAERQTIDLFRTAEGRAFSQRFSRPSTIPAIGRGRGRESIRRASSTAGEPKRS